MTKVHVHYEFESHEEAAAHFARQHAHPTPALAPAPAASAASAAEPTLSTSPIVTTPPVSSTPADSPAAPVMPATDAAVDHTLAVRTHMSDMVARLDSKNGPGSGAVKAKELLTKHGFGRAKDVTADKAPALIADFKVAS